MIPSLSPADQIFLTGVNHIQQQISTASQQLTSGLKVTVASDAPDQIDALLQLRADQAQNSQVESNLSLEQTDAQAADGALGSAIQLMDSATQIAAEGANFSSTVAADETATSDQTLAQQVASLLTEMVNLSQTQVQGQYIFSGDLNQGPSYQLDLNATDGVDQLSNAASTQQIQNPEGGTFSPSMTAQQIFAAQNADGSDAAGNVFAALNNLRVALLNGDQSGITTAQSEIQQASTQLNTAQSFYGNVENTITNATNYGTTYSTQLTEEISGIQDADATSAALQLNESNTQLQAAFEAQGKMPTSSLFDYLA
jgi:flagellar hook-associated protein 3 FlgL